MSRVTTLFASTSLMMLLTACSMNDSSSSMPGMNHSATSGSQATAIATSAPVIDPTVVPTAAAGSMAGMDQGGVSVPFDAMFIDGMIVHHQGAIDMAKDAQAKATKPEIKQLAEAILKTQQAEIDQMKAWRKEWYPDLKDTGGMMINMGQMSVKDGPELYDVRFVAAMIPHHEGALAMANEALSKAKKPEIKTLATDIIKAQSAEVRQMTQWYQAWTGKPYEGTMAGMDHSAQSSGAMTMSGDLKITFSTDPSPLKKGSGTLIILLTDKDGKPVEGAAVKLSVSMTTMDMGAKTGTATDEGGGKYTIKTNFDHAGGLKIIVEAAKDNLIGKQDFTSETK